MSDGLRPVALDRKLLWAETLPEFLARMTVVWQHRQVRVQAYEERQRQFKEKRRLQTRGGRPVKPSTVAISRSKAAPLPVSQIPNSVFALGTFAARGAGAKRREGGSAHL